MQVLASDSYTDSESDQALLAAPSAAAGARRIKRCRLTVTGSLRVVIKVGSDMPFVDNDFDDGGGLSESYDGNGLLVPVGSAVTVTTTGTGTTRITLLGD